MAAATPPFNECLRNPHLPNPLEPVHNLLGFIATDSLGGSQAAWEA